MKSSLPLKGKVVEILPFFLQKVGGGVDNAPVQLPHVGRAAGAAGVGGRRGERSVRTFMSCSGSH